MTYTYTRVGLELWGSQSIGECTQRQLENIKSKRKVRMTMRIVRRVMMQHIKADVEREYNFLLHLRRDLRRVDLFCGVKMLGRWM